MSLTQCECVAAGCSVGHGPWRKPDPKETPKPIARPCSAAPVMVLFRVDIEDHTGTRFCGPCADDAMDNGLFSIGEDAFGDEVAS